jgi:hypothetical protein
MAITQQPTLLHWNYFLALEADLGTLSRFVEFTEDNFATYSIEQVHLFLTTASEVDVVMKQYCAVLAPAESAENIEQYRGIIHPLRPGLSLATASLPRFGVTLTPWSNWQQNRTPAWWADHNRVKHQRSEYFASAHLKNVLNAVGALFLLLIMYYREQADLRRLVPAPALFSSTPDLVKREHALDGETGLYFQR